MEGVLDLSAISLRICSVFPSFLAFIIWYSFDLLSIVLGARVPLSKSPFKSSTNWSNWCKKILARRGLTIDPWGVPTMLLL